METIDLSYSDLSKFTGLAFRTIRKRLADLSPVRRTKREIYFDSRDALKRLYAQPEKDSLDLSAERARLAKLQGDAIEIKNRVLRGELVEADQVKSSGIRVGTMTRHALQAIPNKVAPILTDLNTPAAIADVLRTEIDIVLTKLAKEIRRA